MASRAPATFRTTLAMGFEITIDARNPYRLAHFWAAALPGYEVRPYDDAEIARLASIGLTPETDTSVPIDADGWPTWWFHTSVDKTSSPSPIHFDLAFGERNSEARRLALLGATVRDVRADHIVMLDPEGKSVLSVRSMSWQGQDR